jgi:hypothetical protein
MAELPSSFDAMLIISNKRSVVNPVDAGASPPETSGEREIARVAKPNDLAGLVSEMPMSPLKK